MNDAQRYAVAEVIDSFADGPAPADDYMFCLWVEREINGVRKMGVPWEEIHAAAKNWLAGIYRKDT